MVEWYRARAAQEQSLAANARSREARLVHERLFRMLLQACAGQEGRDPATCDTCALVRPCRSLAAIATLTRFAA